MKKLSILLSVVALMAFVIGCAGTKLEEKIEKVAPAVEETSVLDEVTPEVEEIPAE